MSESPLIEIRDLVIKRGRKTVLAIDYLAIPRGDVLAVVGPNGAGKSTLLLALARLIRPKSGTITFNGISSKSESDLTYRRRIALVLQDSLLFDMSVFDNIASGLKFRGKPRKEIAPTVDYWLKRLDIESLRSRRAHKLSGGEAQRVSIARALALKPDLLLLDEPFSALDPPTRSRLLTDLATLLAETETTAILITHDLDEAAQLGHRIAIVLDGAIRRVGSAEDVLNAEDDPDIRDFTRTFGRTR